MADKAHESLANTQTLLIMNSQAKQVTNSISLDITLLKLKWYTLELYVGTKHLKSRKSLYVCYDVKEFLWYHQSGWTHYITYTWHILLYAMSIFECMYVCEYCGVLIANSYSKDKYHFINSIQFALQTYNTKQKETTTNTWYILLCLCT